MGQELISEIPGHLQKPASSPCGLSTNSLYWLPCKSFLLGEPRQTHGGMNLLFGGDINSLPALIRLTEGKASPRDILDLIDEKERYDLYTDVSFSLIGTNYGFSFTPYRARLFSKTTNLALPRLILFSLLERELNLQTGTYLWGDWYGGLELRLIETKVLRADVPLLGVIVNDELEERLSTETQKGIYFNPSLFYEWEKIQGKPGLFLEAHGLGFVNKPISDWSRPIEIVAGVKGQLTLFSGILDVSFQHRGYPRGEDYVDSFDFDWSYSYGELGFYGSHDRYRWQVGGDWRRGFWQTGLSFLEEDFGGFIGQRQTILWRYGVFF